LSPETYGAIDGLELPPAGEQLLLAAQGELLVMADTVGVGDGSDPAWVQSAASAGGWWHGYVQREPANQGLFPSEACEVMHSTSLSEDGQPVPPGASLTVVIPGLGGSSGRRVEVQLAQGASAGSDVVFALPPEQVGTARLCICYDSSNYMISIGVFSHMAHAGWW
jgi:hypothetical protein